MFLIGVVITAGAHAYLLTILFAVLLLVSIAAGRPAASRGKNQRNRMKPPGHSASWVNRPGLMETRAVVVSRERWQCAGADNVLGLDAR